MNRLVSPFSLPEFDKMNKNFKVLFFVLVLIIPAFVTAQYSFEWGPTYKKDGLFSLYNLVGMEDDHYYVLMAPRRKNTLLKFNQKHKLVSNKDLDFTYKGKNIQLNSLVRTRKGTFGYMSVRDKKANQIRIYASNFENGKFSKVREIYSHTFKMKWRIVGLFGFGNYSNSDAGQTLNISQDSSHVSFMNIVSSQDESTSEKFALAVFDEDMKLVWEKVQKFEYQDKDLNIVQSLVNNKGEIFLIGTLSKKKRNRNKEEKKKGMLRYEYKIFKITKNDMKEVKIDLGSDLEPTSAGLFFPDKFESGNFVASGLYTDSQRKTGVKGVFYASGNMDGGLDIVKTNEFEASFLEGLTTDKNIEKDRGVSKAFRFEKGVQFNDNSIGFIAEEFYITTSTYWDANGRMQTRTIFNGGDIIIPRFDQNGKLLNIQKVEKYFRNESPYIVTFASAVYQNKIYLLFNDLKDRKERKSIKKEGKGKGMYTDLVVLNQDGKIEHNEVLITSSQSDVYFNPFQHVFHKGKWLINGGFIKRYAFGFVNLGEEK